MDMDFILHPWLMNFSLALVLLIRTSMDIQKITVGLLLAAWSRPLQVLSFDPSVLFESEAVRCWSSSFFAWHSMLYVMCCSLSDDFV